MSVWSMEMHNDICMEVVPDTPDRLTSRTTNGSFKSKDIKSGAISSQIGGNTRIVNKQISKGQRDSSTIHYVSDASESNMMYSSIACTSVKGDQLPKKPKSKGLIPENHDHPSCDEINSFPLITGNIDSRHFDYRDTDHSLDVEKKDEKHHKHVRFSYRDQVDSKKEKGSLYRKKASPFLERQMGDSSGKKLIAIEPREKFHEVSTSSGNKDINVAETCNDDYKIINLHNICESKGKQTLEKRVYAPVTKGKKRLVRNGCISPCNIAKREMNLCNGSVHNVYDRMKGKAIITDMDGVRPELQSSRPKTMEAADSIREINLLSDGENWRSVRKQSSKNCLNTSSHDIISISNKTDDGFQNGIEGSDCIVCANTDPEINLLEDCNSPTFQKKCKDNNKPSSSGLLTSRDVEEVRFHGQKELKQGKWAASHHLSVGKCSNPTSDGSDNYQHVVQVLDVNPDKKDNTLGLVRSRQVIDVDALCSPETTSREHHGENRTSSSGIDKVSRQVEEDELLARQLQEQFYDEFQEMNDPEVNARIAIALQQEEDAQYVSSIGSRNSPEYVNSSVTHPPRSYHFGSSRNSSLRSRNRGHIPISTSSRMARLRRNFHGDSIVSSRQRIEFPATLDVFARMDILEALEASVSNNHSVGYAQHFFPGQSDFNENDYEMLLSLDENNPQCGASISQINGLPQSVVQTEEFEEACTICLEHPCKGDAIRHLPCLHKFHKECIDTWLRRKTSCPVCKTSIT